MSIKSGISRLPSASNNKFVIISFIAFCLFGRSVNAQYGGGSGEPNDPYLIYTAEQMNEIGLHENDWNKHFKLMADIDLSQYTGMQFNIIGYYVSYSDNKPFTGAFDGNGHAISNFTYISSNSNITNNIGLFGYVYDADIINLKVIEPHIDVETGNYVGAIAGLFSTGNIAQCSVEGGQISGKQYVGGLIGQNAGYITECQSITMVHSESYGGGLVGRNTEDISFCQSISIVEGDHTLGGLVGHNRFGGKISECHSNCTVNGRETVGGLVGYNDDARTSLCYSLGSINGQKNVGGLCGKNHWDILSCYSAAEITGSDENTGGLIGYNSGTVSACKATGNVQGNKYVSGFVARNTGKITHCYATGSVQGDSDVAGFVAKKEGRIYFCYSTGKVSGNNNIAGLAGGGLVHLCYWDTETSGINESAAGRGKTTDQMKNKSTYRGWGYGNQWVLDEGNDYPRLIWEDTPGEPLVDLPRSYGGGTGEPNTPYQIRTARQLASIAYYLEDYRKHFLLANDIDFSSIDSNEFIPIGVNGYPFTGSLVGNGNNILNFKYHAEGQDCIGLYGYIGQNGYIDNVHLVDVTVTGSENVGALAGYNGGTIRECSVQGTIEGHIMVGGIAGFNEGPITKCSTSGKVTGYWIVGGLIGHAGYSDSTITECFTNCEVTGDYSVGGLIGYNRNADIQACYSNSNVAGRENIGGLVGTNESLGFVAGRAGLPPGHMRVAEQSHISSCYCTGPVQGQEQVGGLVGENQGLVMFCYSSSPVIDISSIMDDQTSVGGLIGYNNYGVVLLSYWDTEISNLSYSAGGKGKTTAQMMTAETFYGWGYIDEWILDEGNDYPHLVWEGLAGEFIVDAPNRYSGGSGEPNEPYQIKTTDELITLANHPIDWDRYFMLNRDLDFNDVNPNQILPIGVYGLPFLGVFDGNNCTISNFRYLSEQESYLGVFGSLGPALSLWPQDSEKEEVHGIIQNLNLENVDISGYCYVGGLTGYSNGTISNCSVKGSITAALEDVGGLSGYNIGKITDCWANCDVTAQGVAGGFIGRNEGPVTACYCSSNVETVPNSSISCTGGFIGYNYGIIEQCHFNGIVNGGSNTGGLIGINNGTILNCSASGQITGMWNVGGLVGDQWFTRSISRSFSNSFVSGDNRVGGLVGYNSGDISNCYAIGNVNGIRYIGGLAGKNSQHIMFCYSSCTVHGQKDIAGFVSESRWADIISCFWDTDVSDLMDGVADQDPDPEGVIGLSTTEMQMESTFTDAGWDFVGETANGTEDIWWILEGQDYPRLWWELDQSEELN